MTSATSTETVAAGTLAALGNRRTVIPAPAASPSQPHLPRMRSRILGTVIAGLCNPRPAGHWSCGRSSVSPCRVGVREEPPG